MTAAIRHAEELFDLLAESDLPSDEILSRTGWNYVTFMTAAQTLRDMLAEAGDVISVTAEPQGNRQPWLYSLKAGQAILDPEQSRWIRNRLHDSERRLKTINAVLGVAAQSLDGRTLDGKKARIYHLHIKRAQEEVTLLTGSAE